MQFKLHFWRAGVARLRYAGSTARARPRWFSSPQRTSTSAHTPPIVAPPSFFPSLESLSTVDHSTNTLLPPLNQSKHQTVEAFKARKLDWIFTESKRGSVSYLCSTLFLIIKSTRKIIDNNNDSWSCNPPQNFWSEYTLFSEQLQLWIDWFIIGGSSSSEQTTRVYLFYTDTIKRAASRKQSSTERYIHAWANTFTCLTTKQQQNERH